MRVLVQCILEALPKLCNVLVFATVPILEFQACLWIVGSVTLLPVATAPVFQPAKVPV